MTDTPHTVNAYGVDPNTIDAAHADRVARALGLAHAVRIGCGGFLHGISRGVLTITPEPFDLRNPRIVSVPWALIERLGEVVKTPEMTDIPITHPLSAGLRHEAEGHQTVYGEDRRRKGLFAAAADELDRRAAEIARLRAEVGELRETLSHATNDARALREELKSGELREGASRDAAQLEVTRLRAEVEALREDLRYAEAALSDIGDADREPGDDLAWCERRAAKALPRVRAAIGAARTPEGRSDG